MILPVILAGGAGSRLGHFPAYFTPNSFYV